MPYKDKEKQKDYQRRRHQQIRLQLQRLKEVPCMDCGVSYPHYQMEFDHVPERGSKLFSISTFGGIKDHNNQRLQQELAKCDVVCVLCHAERTWIRRQNHE
jgi:hypothetical protein